MSFNTFGHSFRVTTFGESHGPAIGCVVDGCPPRIALARSRHPALSRSAPARPIALHHAAPGAGRGQNPLRRVRGRGDRHAGDDRHADRARHRQCRPALQGLFRHQGQVSSRPCRLHLRRQIRRARLSRRRPPVGARDGDARRRRGDRAQDRAGPAGARRARADGPACDRSRALGLGRGRAQSVLLPRRGKGGVLRRLSRRRAQARLFRRRSHRGRRRGRAAGPRRAASTASSTAISPPR